jgi:hypothetical protein
MSEILRETTLPTQAIEAARDAMRERGIEVYLPWEGDLSDLENERYEALCAALIAARPYLGGAA